MKHFLVNMFPLYLSFVTIVLGYLVRLHTTADLQANLLIPSSSEIILGILSFDIWAVSQGLRRLYYAHEHAKRKATAFKMPVEIPTIITFLGFFMFHITLLLLEISGKVGSILSVNYYLHYLFYFTTTYFLVFCAQLFIGRQL